MTMTTFSCTECGKTLSAGDDLIGGQVQCPFCETVLHLPQSQPAAEPELQVTGQAVSGMYHHARLDYEAGGSAFGVLCIEVLLVAGVFGLWARSAWVFGGLLVLMILLLVKYRQFADVFCIALGVAGGVISGMVLYVTFNVSCAIVGGVLIGAVLAGLNLLGLKWGRT